jgi:hypothetical protein
MHTTEHTGRVPRRFDRVKAGPQHRVGGDQVNRSSGRDRRRSMLSKIQGRIAAQVGPAIAMEVVETEITSVGWALGVKRNSFRPIVIIRRLLFVDEADRAWQDLISGVPIPEIQTRNYASDPDAVPLCSEAIPLPRVPRRRQGACCHG